MFFVVVVVVCVKIRRIIDVYLRVLSQWIIRVAFDSINFENKLDVCHTVELSFFGQNLGLLNMIKSTELTQMFWIQFSQQKRSKRARVFFYGFEIDWRGEWGHEFAILKLLYSKISQILVEMFVGAMVKNVFELHAGKNATLDWDKMISLGFWSQKALYSTHEFFKTRHTKLSFQISRYYLWSCF